MLTYLSEQCDVCGYEWDELTPAEIPQRLAAVGRAFATVMSSGDAELLIRPEPSTWSAVEYGSHVRDVLLHLRDRIVLGLAEDNPTPKPMFADVRLRAGIYAADRPDDLAQEIPFACRLMARLVAALDDRQLARPIFYPYPVPATRTLLWVASQSLHEAEHHLADIR